MYKTCSLCGASNDENSKFCTSCGAPFSTEKTNASYSENTHYVNGNQPYNSYSDSKQNSYQNMYNSQNNNSCNNTYSSQNDKPDTLYNVLSFLIPLAGLIIFLSEKDKSPKKARSAAKFALISVAVRAVAYVIIFVCSMFFQFAVTSFAFEQITDAPFYEEFSFHEDYSYDGNEFVSEYEFEV